VKKLVIFFIFLINTLYAFEVSLPLSRVEAISTFDGKFITLDQLKQSASKLPYGIKLTNDKLILKSKNINDLYLSNGDIARLSDINSQAMGGEMGGGK